MNEKTIKVTFGALLHDIGKPVYRAEIKEGNPPHIAGADFLSTLYEDEDLIASVRYHQKDELLDYNYLIPDSPAYISFIADQIAAGYACAEGENADTEKTADRRLPISAIFNRIHGRNSSFTYDLKPLTEKINYPNEGENIASEADYQNLLTKIRDGLGAIEIKEQSINALLSLLESCLSYVPTSTTAKDMADISLYDHSKMAAAFGACISEFLQDSGVTDYRTELLVKEDIFLDKKAFLLVSGDFSGIQSFIFQVITDDALKRLRSRSFFLEILMEHIVDWILAGSGVSRANLIYSGGGHCYLLLPNTEAVIRKLEEIRKRTNSWLRGNFGTSLYYACAYTECSANDLMNKPANEAPYEQIFRRLSKMLSKEKLHRYSAQEILELNHPSEASGARECKICGTEANLCKDNDVCEWCDRFAAISSKLLDPELTIVAADQEPEDHRYLPFPKEDGEEYYYLVKKKEARDLLEDGIVKRIYMKNQLQIKDYSSTNLFVGDYAYDTRVEMLLDQE
jgi:CRISPR-associated protein Csm1